MEGVKNSPAFAQKVGIPQSVGQDFVAADDAQKPAKIKRDRLVKALTGNR